MTWFQDLTPKGRITLFIVAGVVLIAYGVLEYLSSGDVSLSALLLLLSGFLSGAGVAGRGVPK